MNYYLVFLLLSELTEERKGSRFHTEWPILFEGLPS